MELTAATAADAADLGVSRGADADGRVVLRLPT